MTSKTKQIEYNNYPKIDMTQDPKAEHMARILANGSQIWSKDSVIQEIYKALVSFKNEERERCVKQSFSCKKNAGEKEPKCQRLDMDGKQCNRKAVYWENYHGDNELYGYTDSAGRYNGVGWVRVALCGQHCSNKPDSDNFAGYIKSEDSPKPRKGFGIDIIKELK